jgi:hypothetical protein
LNATDKKQPTVTCSLDETGGATINWTGANLKDVAMLAANFLNFTAMTLAAGCGDGNYEGHLQQLVQGARIIHQDLSRANNEAN